jgi:hypothetical protein
LFFVAKQSYELTLRLLRAEKSRPRNDGNLFQELFDTYLKNELTRETLSLG